MPVLVWQFQPLECVYHSFGTIKALLSLAVFNTRLLDNLANSDYWRVAWCPLLSFGGNRRYWSAVVQAVSSFKSHAQYSEGSKLPPKNCLLPEHSSGRLTSNKSHSPSIRPSHDPACPIPSKTPFSSKAIVPPTPVYRIIYRAGPQLERPLPTTRTGHGIPALGRGVTGELERVPAQHGQRVGL